MRGKTIPHLLAVACLLAAALGAAGAASAQTILAHGLDFPYKMARTPGGNLLLAESGTGAHDGRLLMIARHGAQHVLLSGLPSGVIPQGDALGPTAVADAHRTLYVLIGEGDILGPAPPGSHVPNPSGLSSALFSSVIRAVFDPVPDGIRTGFHLGHEELRQLADGHAVSLENEAGEKVELLVLADFRDLEPDPVFGVRQSNPFAMAIDGSLTPGDLQELGLPGASIAGANFLARLLPDSALGQRLRERTRLWVIDSGMNTLVEVRAHHGRHSVFHRFPVLPNPLFPTFGPPVMEAVPTSVHVRQDGDLLVTLFPGFPFPPGAAAVYRVDSATGEATPWITGLSSATEVLEVGGTTYVLELSTDFLGMEPGRILRFASPGATPEVVVGGLIGAAGMVYDAVRHELVVSEAFTGRVLRIPLD